MDKETKQLDAFISEAQEIARLWTLQEARGIDTGNDYVNRMHLVHKLAKSVMLAEDDKAVDNE